MNKRDKYKHKKKSNKSGKNRTPISGHTRIGDNLLPPFAKIKNVSLSSWMNERLPEMLWAELIRSSMPQDYALGQFRRFLNFIGQHTKKEHLFDATLTGFSKLDESLQEEIISYLIEPPEAAYALSTLRFFINLPARKTWDKLLPAIKPDLNLLMKAVGSNLWHQSQEATDCRWLKLMTLVVTGKFHITEETAKEWFGYPNEGNQRAVRPLIRATELAPPLEHPDLTWANNFWAESWESTPCLELDQKKSVNFQCGIITRAHISEIANHLEHHWKLTHSTTSIDAKHDAVFGMAFYALRIIDDMLGIAIGSSILARLGLRTILEVHINLRFLLNKNDDNFWKKWRTYGSGQAKLNALKFDDSLEPPKYIDIDNIEKIAGEDVWEEFLNINLANWSGSDLRRISEQSGLKDTYDKYYSWTSGYSHGMWGPIRESCFNTCGNPLHRLHRYPHRQALQDAVDDAAELIDEILCDLNRAYPGFSHRLLIKINTEQINSTDPAKASDR